MMASGYYKQGADVIISSRNEQTCKEAVEMIQSLEGEVAGGSVRYIPADVSTRSGAEGEFVCKYLSFLCSYEHEMPCKSVTL